VIDVTQAQLMLADDVLHNLKVDAPQKVTNLRKIFDGYRERSNQLYKKYMEIKATEFTTKKGVNFNNLSTIYGGYYDGIYSAARSVAVQSPVI
jgi:hypothetical protein